MLTYNLFNKILIEPVLNNSQATHLQIVTGYSSPTMARQHIEKLAALKLDKPIHIDLIIGMPEKYRKIRREEVFEFSQLTKNSWGNISISCRYIREKAHPTHAKTYCWLSADGTPIVAYTGSANYTLKAFGLHKQYKQTETMTYANATATKKFYERQEKYSVDCNELKSKYQISLQAWIRSEIWRRQKAQTNSIVRLIKIIFLLVLLFYIFDIFSK